jgi:sodium-dependent dicarboxylate transporter 2/3/5
MDHTIQKPYETRVTKRNIFFILLSFFILIVIYFFPTPEGLTHDSQMMIGILIMATVLWITEPIPLAVTGLLIMILQPLLGLISADNVFSSFGSQAIFFLIGAFIIAGAVEKYGLHRRMALGFLRRFENSPRFFTFGIMLSCALLSFVMPNHGVAALFLPIITSILIAMKIVPRMSNFGKICMLCVAYGCSIGSLGTLIGGARNPLTISFLEDIGITVTFFDWMLYSMPVVFISLPIVWIILQISFPVETHNISLAKKEIENQVALGGPIGKNELTVLLVLCFTVFLWVFFSQYTYFGIAGIAILGCVILFFTGSLSWKDVEQRLPWGIILLYGGAITLGIGMQQTGAGAWIAHSIFNYMSSDPIFVILGLIIFTVLLTNAMSNTGAVAVLLPIGLAIATEIPGVSPLLSAMLIALSGGLAFILVIATPGNAIAYSSGYFSTRDLLKAGVIANIICIGILFAIAIIYWKGVLGL